MTCRTCGSAGVTLVTCFLRELGITATKWSEDAHVALYNRLATNVNVLSEREVDGDTLRAIYYGQEPDATARYFYRTILQFTPASSDLWRCNHTDYAAAKEQVRNESGAFYTELVAASSHVLEAEKVSPYRKTGEGIPGWLVVGGGILAVLGIGYAVTR